MKVIPVRFALVVAAFGVVLMGCSKKDPADNGPVADVGQPIAEPKAGTEPANPNTTPEDEARKKLDAALERGEVKNKDGVVQEKPFVIKGVGQEGWMKTAITPAELGRKVDAAMSKLQGVHAEASLLVQGKALEGRNSGLIDVADPDNYKIEYQMPDDPTKLAILQSEGGERAYFEGGKWKRESAKASQPLISRWPKTFTREIFAGLTHGESVWAPLLSALSQGAGGYAMALEQKVMPVGRNQKLFYRVLAQKADKSIQMELRFDGDRFVPLTIKVKNSTGVKFSDVQWQARWSFNNRLDASKFKLPEGI